MHVLIFDIIYEDNISPGITYLSSFLKDYSKIFHYHGFSESAYLTILFLCTFHCDLSLNGMSVNNSYNKLVAITIHVHARLILNVPVHVFVFVLTGFVLVWKVLENKVEQRPITSLLKSGKK